jgi:hypothetical protein
MQFYATSISIWSIFLGERVLTSLCISASPQLVLQIWNLTRFFVALGMFINVWFQTGRWTETPNKRCILSHGGSRLIIFAIPSNFIKHWPLSSVGFLNMMHILYIFSETKTFIEEILPAHQYRQYFVFSKLFMDVSGYVTGSIYVGTLRHCNSSL